MGDKYSEGGAVASEGPVSHVNAVNDSFASLHDETPKARLPDKLFDWINAALPFLVVLILVAILVVVVVPVRATLRNVEDLSETSSSAIETLVRSSAEPSLDLDKPAAVPDTPPGNVAENGGEGALSEKSKVDRVLAFVEGEKQKELDTTKSALEKSKDEVEDLKRQVLEREKSLNQANEDARKAVKSNEEAEKKRKDAVAAQETAAKERDEARARADLLAKDLAACKSSLEAAEIEAFKQLVKALNELFLSKNEKGLPKVVTEVSRVTSDSVSDVIQTKLEDRIANVQKHLLAFEDQIKSMASQLKREAEAEDVALILFNSRVLHVNRYFEAVEQLASENPYRNFRRFRYGVYIAANSTVQKTLLDLKQTHFDPQAFTAPNIGDQKPTATEDPHGLDVLKLIFKKAQPEKSGRQRRCALVLSTDCRPLQANNKNWDGVDVDVILVDQQVHIEDAGRQYEVLQRCLAWDQFCRAHNGEAIVFRVARPSVSNAGGQPKSDVPKKASPKKENSKASTEPKDAGSNPKTAANTDAEAAAAKPDTKAAAETGAQAAGTETKQPGPEMFDKQTLEALRLRIERVLRPRYGSGNAAN